MPNYCVDISAAKDNINIVVTRRMKIRSNTEMTTWQPVDRFNTTSLEKIPASKQWFYNTRSEMTEEEKEFFDRKTDIENHLLNSEIVSTEPYYRYGFDQIISNLKEGRPLAEFMQEDESWWDSPHPLETHQYRLTRPTVYGPNTPGHTDKSARQGYYISATSEEEAKKKISQYLREEYGIEEDTFDVQLWDGR